MKKHRTLRRLLSYARPFRVRLILMALFAVAANSLALVAPLFIGRGVDALSPVTRDESFTLPGLLVLLGCIYVAASAFQWGLSVFSVVIANGTVRNIRKDAFSRLMHLPVRFFDTKAHGDVTSRFTNDIDAMSDGLLQGMTLTLASLVTLVASLVFMLVISPVITGVVVLITPLCIWISSTIAKHSRRMFSEQSRVLGELNGYVEEMVSGQKTVRAFSMEKSAEEAFDKINAELHIYGRKAQYYASLTNPATRLVTNLSYIIVGTVGALMTVSGTMTVGQILSFLVYATLFARPINDITSVTAQLQSALAAADRVFGLLDEKPEPDDAGLPDLQDDPSAYEGGDVKDDEVSDVASRAAKAASLGDVAFQNVSFSYHRGHPLMRNINLEARPGERIAIVGPTGAGKTTLANLLLRFYDVDGGQVEVDGTDIRTVTRRSLRQAFGMVLQEPWVFSGTVAENIAYGRPEASREEVEAAARAAHAHSFIRRLSQGYDTPLTSDGGSLSEGQLQLLAIARVLLLDPPMLMLDEATSNIDSLTEIQVQKAFQALMHGRTSFVIAHRLSTIEQAHHILVMKEGDIVEQGTHEALLRKKGLYAALYHSG